MHAQLAFLNVGGPEMIMICAIALLLFGSENLPKLARGIGKSMSEFQKAKQEFEYEITRVTELHSADNTRLVEDHEQKSREALELELAELRAQAAARKAPPVIQDAVILDHEVAKTTAAEAPQA